MDHPAENQQPLGTARGVRSLPTTSFRSAPISSTSNYVNQNVFPSISSFSTSHLLNPDSFPHQFHPSHQNNNAYQNNNTYIHPNHQNQQHHPLSNQNQVPLHSVRTNLSPLPFPSHPLPYPPHFPDSQSLLLPSHPLAPALAPNHFLNPHPSTVPFIPFSAKPLPTVSHISLLSGWTYFGAWNDSVRTLLLHLGCLGHISDPQAPGFVSLPDRVPTYPSLLYAPPSPVDLSNYKMWWEQDNIASHVLLSRLSPTV